MTPTEATRDYYRKAMGLAACARSFVTLGMWRDAHRALDNAREYWLKVEWKP